MSLTEWEVTVIKYCAGAGRLADSDRLWDTAADLQRRGLLVGVDRGMSTRVVPTPEALAEALEQNGHGTGKFEKLENQS